MADYSYIGSGKVYLVEVGTSAGLVEVGNCSALNFAVQEEVKEQRDYTSPGGGVLNEVRRITGVEITATIAELSPLNLARALYGTTSSVVAGSVTDEVVAAYQGSLSRLLHASPAAVVVAAENGDAAARVNETVYALDAYINLATPNDYFYKCTVGGTSAASPPSFGTTVGGTTTDGTVTWTCMGLSAPVSGTDYEVRPGGIYWATDGKLTDGETYEIDYTYGAEDVVQALASSAKEYVLHFEGLNEARSGKAMLVDAWRVKFGAVSNLAFIGDDFASIELTGKVLKDSTKIGGISQFFKTTAVQ